MKWVRSQTLSVRSIGDTHGREELWGGYHWEPVLHGFLTFLHLPEQGTECLLFRSIFLISLEHRDGMAGHASYLWKTRIPWARSSFPIMETAAYSGVLFLFYLLVCSFVYLYSSPPCKNCNVRKELPQNVDSSGQRTLCLTNCPSSLTLQRWPLFQHPGHCGTPTQSSIRKVTLDVRRQLLVVQAFARVWSPERRQPLTQLPRPHERPFSSL